MYGAVLGKHKRISLKELELVQPQNLKIYQNIALFDTDAPEKIEGLAGIIKRGKIITSDDIQAADIIGTNSRELGKVVKKQGLTRRFKDIDETKTDEEIRSKGKEYIVVDDDFEKIIAVEGYQSIALYESVDFEKPVNSMKIGMMPAKLTQMMINIGLANISPREDTTIYDPFV